MGLRLYNTLTRKKELFRPARKGQVRIYNCGPTVYDYAHVGNFRSYVFADLLRRYLEWKGFRVIQIMNITDVGHMTLDENIVQQGTDKIEAAAKQKGMTPREIADRYTMAFFEDVSRLNLRKAFFYPRATDHIDDMIRLVEELMKKGLAYQRKSGVYFDVRKFRKYGKLSGNTITKLQAGSRVAVRTEKRSPFDFALWIHNPAHVMQWDSPWGRGYPGWHIECSAMSLRYLGEGFDIHTGGEDNIFPHHECEIAQAEGAGKRFARYWLHVRHLSLEGKKMSKRTGNFFTLHDVLSRGHSPREVRYLLLSAQYRTKMNFTESGLKAAATTISNLERFLSAVRNAKPGNGGMKVRKRIAQAGKEFEDALDDDLNISKGLASLFDFVRDVQGILDAHGLRRKDAAAVERFVRDLDCVLGLELSAAEWLPATSARGEVKNLIMKRGLLRKKKRYKDADAVRKLLAGRGIVVEDTAQGTLWKHMLRQQT